jgi:hypothetical protein
MSLAPDFSEVPRPVVIREWASGTGERESIRQDVELEHKEMGESYPSPFRLADLVSSRVLDTLDLRLDRAFLACNRIVP